MIPSGKTRQTGATLTEVLVSVLLFSLAIIGLLRSLGTTLRESGEVEYRSVATTLADERIGRMWVDRSGLSSWTETAVAITELPGGTRTTSVAGNVVTVTITWQPPGGVARRHSVSATLASN